MGTYRGGLVVVGSEVTAHTAENSGLPHNAVTAVAFDRGGRLWAATAEGLCSNDGDEWRVYTQENSGLPSHDIRTLAADRNGLLWIGSDVGITRFRVAAAD